MVKRRPGHRCEYACTVMAVVLWEAIGSPYSRTVGYEETEKDREREKKKKVERPKVKVR